MKWRRDARDKRHFIIMSAVAVLVLVIGLFFDQNGEQAVETSGTQTVTVREGAVTDAAVMAAPVSESAVQAVATPSPEDGIYTYLQGPKSWKERREWSGKWGKTFYDGKSFGAFGCVLCALLYGKYLQFADGVPMSSDGYLPVCEKSNVLSGGRGHLLGADAGDLEFGRL